MKIAQYFSVVCGRSCVLFVVAGLLLLLPVMTEAQSAKIDSLTVLIEAAAPDTSKLRLLLDLSKIYGGTDLNKQQMVLAEAYELAHQISLEEWTKKTEVRIGINYANLNQPDSALYYFKKAEDYYVKHNNFKDLAPLYSYISWVHTYNDDYEEALIASLENLKMNEKIGARNAIGKSYLDIGEILYRQDKFEEATTYTLKGYELLKQTDEYVSLASTIQLLARIYNALDQHDRALALQAESMQLQDKIGQPVDKALALNGRGLTFMHLERYDEALADYMESLKLAKAVGFFPLEKTLYGNLGATYNLAGNYAAALPYHLKMKAFQQAEGLSFNRVENYEALAEAYAGVGKTDSAYFYQKQATEIGDSLLNVENAASMNELQTQYETAQKEATIAQQETQLIKVRHRFWTAVIVGGILFLSGGVLFYLMRQLSQRNREKEFLIKEVHHRVRNNLQMLSSLLYLQSLHINDDKALHAVQEGRSRVEAIGLMHQKLYTGTQLSTVPMRDYLFQLGQGLLDTFNIDDRDVVIDYDVDDVHLDVDSAIPLSLIVNELITNSLKYAFPNRRSGKIQLTLQRTAGKELYLSVADNGVGTTPAENSEPGTKFGTHLIDILSQKLDGKPRISRSSEGYRTEFSFRLVWTNKI